MQTKNYDNTDTLLNFFYCEWKMNVKQRNVKYLTLIQWGKHEKYQTGKNS